MFRWLGRLSVGRKLMLIYLLDLTAVIYVSGILIHEKFLAIDFARKEIAGTEYAAVVRDAVLLSFPGVATRPDAVPQALTRLQEVRAVHDEALRTAESAERFAFVLQHWPTAGDLGPVETAQARERLLRTGRALLTTVGN
ncbi:MAG: sensor domain-containing diguanylate cyclase, partial [Burkholderiaceae bacterium]